MIISDRFRYVFVELPNTASTAISRELEENYDGHPILFKHAYYHEFERVATPEQKLYFAFSCIRHPMDISVTRYFKLKSNDRQFFTEPRFWRRNGGHVTGLDLKMYRFITEKDATFPDFFRKFFRWPYVQWAALAHKRFNFVIRFEELQRDFAMALHTIGLEPVRSLPVVNKTTEKSSDFFAYYTPQVRDHAQWIFGPYLKEWGYSLPAEWGNRQIPLSSEILYRALKLYKRMRWHVSSVGSKRARTSPVFEKGGPLAHDPNH